MLQTAGWWTRVREKSNVTVHKSKIQPHEH
jgi:hypothetical protein